MKPSKIFIALILLLFYQQNAFAQLIPFCEKSKWGFANTDGKIVLPCIYDAVEFYSDDNLAKVKKGGKYGYINKQGIIVIPLDYQDCSRIYEIYHNEHSVGIKPNSAVNLSTEFDWTDVDSQQNRYVVSKNSKYGVLNLKNGKSNTIIPCTYSGIRYDPEKKVFHCTNGTNTDYFDKNGVKLTHETVNSIVKPQYSSADFGSENLPLIVQVNGKYGVIKELNYYRGKKNYDTLVPPIYDSVIIDNPASGFAFNHDFFAVKKNGRWGAFDNKHTLILPIEYDNIQFDLSKYSKHWLPYSRSFYVQQNGKWGVLGKKEKSDTLTVLLPFEYDGFKKMYYSYTSVEKSGKFEIYNNSDYSIITKKSYPVITEYEYESVGPFELFEVTNQAGQTVYIGENGVEFFKDY